MFFPCRHWKPTLAIKLSLLVLAGCIVATLWCPAWWKQAAGIVFLNHLILTLAGLIPRSTILGPNITRLPGEAARRGEVAITIDDGPDPDVTPQVLDILDRYAARVTFFCIGNLALRHPELCREIVRRGHAVENHTQTHNVLFWLFGPWRIHRELRESQRTLANITGRVPRFFRPTAGLRGLQLEPVLAHHGLRLCSWSKRGFDTRVTNPDAVFRRLTRHLEAGDILLLHDGSAARTDAGKPVILEVLSPLLEHVAQRSLRAVSLDSAIP